MSLWLSKFYHFVARDKGFHQEPAYKICDSTDAEDYEISGRPPKSEIDFIHRMVKGICYENARDFFRF